MRKVLFINTSVNSGSTGRIAEEIGQTAIENGYHCYFGYGRLGRNSKLEKIRIGNDIDIKLHGLESILFDNHGFASRNATIKFIQEIERINPDIINIHNIHGYYMNVEILFEYLASTGIPVVWTFHDCWPFTGHCSFFDRYHCEKWKSGCYDCPNSKGYPKSLFLDRSKSNYKRKKELFNKPQNITIIPVCHWMENNVKQSFLKDYPTQVIYNGVDIDVFKPSIEKNDEIKKKTGIATNQKVILGVASIWDQRKGLDDFVKLRELLDNSYSIVLVGLSEKQIKNLPEGIIGIRRTENVHQLAELYSMADVFVNPTYIDNFPNTNIEALACGTPVVVYRTGGCPEAVDDKSGFVVNQGDIYMLKSTVEFVSNNKLMYSAACRERVIRLYNKHDRYNDYVSLFDNLIKERNKL